MGKELFHTSVGGMGSPEDGGETGVAGLEIVAEKTAIVGGGVGGSSAAGMSHTTKSTVLTYTVNVSLTNLCCFITWCNRRRTFLSQLCTEDLLALHLHWMQVDETLTKNWIIFTI